MPRRTLLTELRSVPEGEAFSSEGVDVSGSSRFCAHGEAALGIIMLFFVGRLPFLCGMFVCESRETTCGPWGERPSVVHVMSRVVEE